MTLQEELKKVPWHAKTIEESCIEIGCSKDLFSKGLSSADANARLEQYGYNKLTEKDRKTLCRRIYDQLANVLVAVLVIVAVVAASQAATAENTDKLITNTIEVALIVFVIT
jgi:magnesium-transporting ATPase (P-type)